MDSIQKKLLAEVADLHDVPQGAYSLRINGSLYGKNSSENIEIVAKTDKPGIDIYVKAGTKNESLHIPVILSQSGLKELVYNDFHIGEDCDVTIVAGCGIHNGGDEASEHSGIHAFYVSKNAKIKYVEKHYGQGDGNGENIMNPTTYVELAENAHMEMETVQIKGVDSTVRDTKAHLAAGAKLIMTERLLTHGNQYARSDMDVYLDGEDASSQIISRSVAKDNSTQTFLSKINGNAECYGHTECDAIIMDNAVVKAVNKSSFARQPTNVVIITKTK